MLSGFTFISKWFNMAFKIEMVKAYIDPMEDIMKETSFFSTDLLEQLNLVGKEAEDKMIQLITDGKKRPQNGEPTSLEDHIKTTYFQDEEQGWGLGDIEELNKFAEYWAAVNWGSAHMVGRRVPNGSFAPNEPQPDISFFRQDRWVTGEGNHSFVVLNPIPALNYIENTVDWLNGRLEELTKKVG
jgi:hypothetical protein